MVQFEQPATFDFDRFSESALKPLFFARSSVSEFGGASVASEHLVLGLLRAAPEVVERFLGPRDSADALTREIKERVSTGPWVSTEVDIPLALEVSWILRKAIGEATAGTGASVRAEHILLAVLVTSNGTAAQVLRAHGVRESDVRLYIGTLTDGR